MKQIHVKLTEMLHRNLRIQAAIKGQSLQGYVVRAIQNQIVSDQSTSDSVVVLAKEASNDSTTR